MLADTTAPTDRQADDLAKLAKTIRKCHETIGRVYDHIRTHGGTALDSAMAAGDALRVAKKKLGQHGKWLPWLKKHCGLSECEAQRYMRVAKNREKIEAEIEANPARVTDLSLRGALRLISSPKVIEAAAEPIPTEAVEEPMKSSTEDRLGGSRVTRANAFDPVAWWSEHSVDERRTFLEASSSKVCSKPFLPTGNARSCCAP